MQTFSNRQFYDIFTPVLTIPFLNPYLSNNDEIKLQEEICNKIHYPFPGVRIKISKSILKKYILLTKRKGIDGLLPKHCFRKTKKCKNEITAQIMINLDKPWKCLQQLEKIIENADTPFKKEQQFALDIFRKVSIFSWPYMHKPVSLGIEIDAATLKEIEELKTSTHKRISNKAKAILMAREGRPLWEITLKTDCPIRTIQGWFLQFKKRGLAFVKGKRDYTRQNIERNNRKNIIVSILHQLPKDYGQNRAAWDLQSIANVYEQIHGIKISSSTVARDIKKTNYTWKRARRVLTSPDPEYKEKTKKVIDALQSLGPNDCFFFIDEAGPWQVKKYGGKSLTLKGTTKIIPQFQSPKGRVSLIGALDAIKNQMTYIFVKSKDTMAVIILIKILYFKYRKCSRINITWDCASWHKSKQLKAFLQDVKKFQGPVVNIVPLPKRAQFLNVIESVFGGLKKAVIFNSDYQSEYEMKMTISRHFQERNEFFKNNPKRAGNKIWDKESFEIGDFEGGVYKMQM